MNLPATHWSHDAAFASGCTVPGLHSVGTAAPVAQKEPSGHSTQSPALVITARSAFW